MSPLEEQIFRVAHEAQSVNVTLVAVATVGVFVVLVLGFTFGHVVDILR